MCVPALGCAAALLVASMPPSTGAVDELGAPPPAALLALLDGARTAATDEILAAAGDLPAVLAALAACQPGAETRYPWGARWGAVEARALLDALLESPAEEVRAAALAAAPRGRPDALAALVAQAELGPRTTLEDIAAASRSLDWSADDRQAELTLMAAVAASVPASAEDSREDLQRFTRTWSAFAVGARPAALAAVASRNQVFAFRIAAALLPFEQVHEVTLLSILHGAADAAPAIERQAATAAVRERLAVEHPRASGAAARAAGALTDEEAIEPLVELLLASDEGLRRAAHAALRDITGRGFPLDFEAWSRWLADEERWWSEAAGLRRVLVAGSPAAASNALREIALRSTRPADRAHLAALALEHDEFPVRVQACAVLGRNSVDEAVDALEDAAENDSDARVRAAAARAYARLHEGR